MATQRRWVEAGPDGAVAAGTEVSTARWIWAAAALVSTVPLLRMANWIRSGTHVQYADYWPILAQTYNHDGSIDLAGLTTFHAQHLLTLTQLTYVANITLFGGSNISLGFWVLTLVVVQVGLLWSWLARMRDLPVALRAVLGVLVATLLLSPNGAWNFLYAMSGAAWLTANLLSVLAIHLMVRGHVATSVVAAVAATLTYGTGLMAWPAIILVAVWVHRQVRVVAPVAGTALVVVGAYWLRRAATGHSRLGDPGVLQVLENTAIVIGGLFTNSVGWAVALGAAGLATLLVAWSVAAWRNRTDMALWMALSLYGVGAAGLIGYGRQSSFGGGSGHLLASRYSSLAALVWICVAVSVTAGAVSVARSWSRPEPSHLRLVARTLVVAIVVVAGVSVVLADTGPVSDASRSRHRMVELSLAQTVGVAAGRNWFPLVEQPDLSGVLPVLGHHPHDGREDFSCVRLGTTLEADPTPVGGQMGRDPDPAMLYGVRLTGWVEVPNELIECILVVDDEGAVVGLGMARERNDHSSHVVAYVAEDSDDLSTVVWTDSDLHSLSVSGQR